MTAPRRSWSEGLRHAFSLGPKGPVPPPTEDEETIDRVLRTVVRRGMSGPALLFLESVRPLNGIGAAAMNFFAPFASVLVDERTIGRLARYLEARGSIEWVCRRLEVLEAEYAAASTAPRSAQLPAADDAPATASPDSSDS